MNRRNFLTWLGLGWGLAWISNAIAGCSNNASNSQPSGATSTSSTPSNAGLVEPGGFVKIGTTQDLEEKGRILFQQGANSSVLAIRDPANPNSIFAVDSRCTHRGCTVDWNSDRQEILCPCHGSAFQADGKVRKGPASKPLERFEAKIEGNAVLVKIAKA
jgi:cytochrome b6-f complex iron-sulfur subunit